MSVNEDLGYEVTELRAEIARHHRDFERIRKVLEDMDALVGVIHERGTVSYSVALKQIREIVG